MSIVAVDLDNTLTTGEGDPYWVDHTNQYPDRTMIEVVNTLYNHGHTIIIYTARKEDARAKTEWFLDEHGVKFHALRMEKLGYDLLLDDEVMNENRVTSSSQVEDYLE